MYLCLYPFLNRHTNAEYTDWRRYKYTDIQWCRTIYSCRLQSMIVDTVLQRALLGLGVKMWRSQGRTCVVAFLPHIFDDGPVAWRCDQMWPEKIFSCEVSSGAAGFIGVSPGVFVFDFKALPGATKRSRRQVADCDSVTGESLCLLKSMPSWQVLEQILKDTKKERNDIMKWIEVIWNDPANNEKRNKTMKREVKVTTKKSKETKTRLASNYM